MEGQHPQQGHVKARVLIRRKGKVTFAGNGDLVIQLHIRSGDKGSQCQYRFPLWGIICHGSRNRLRQRNFIQHMGKLGEGGFKPYATLG